MNPNPALPALADRQATKHERVNEIDLLRFLAALMVVFFHYAFRGHAGRDHMDMAYPILAPVAKYGYLGVELFFMISGFVILMTASGSSVRRFAASRIVRLYPAFWACCTITFLVTLAMGAERFDASVGQYLANMTMFSGFVYIPSIDGVYWSLFVELQFYFLIAALLVIGQIRRAEIFMALWLVATVAIEAWQQPQLSRLLITDYSVYFIAGGACYLVHRNGMKLFRAVLLAGAWLVALYQSTRVAGFAEQFQTQLNPFVIGAIVTGFFVVMLAVATRRTAGMGKYSWTALGALTYPLYLLHQNIGYMLFNALHPQVNTHILFWGMIALMLGISYAVHVWIERPVAPMLEKAINATLDAGSRLLRLRADASNSSKIKRPPTSGSGKITACVAGMSKEFHGDSKRRGD